MVRLEEKYDQAVQFRKRGFTYSEISKIVGVSKSTVSNWLSKKSFSKKVRDDNTKRAARDNVKRIGLINKSRATERQKQYAEAIRSAETEYKHYKKSHAFTAGLMTYVCNGDQGKETRIRLSSSSWLVHKIFVLFAQEYLGVDKNDIHMWLLLHADSYEKKTMSIWSNKLALPVSQFYKTQFVQQKSSNEALQHGTGNTIIGNTVAKKKLLRWIELFSKEQ